MIGIVNYGAGNLQSILNALEKLNFDYFMINSKEDMTVPMDLCLFPGVGHFDNAITNLHQKGLFKPLKDYILADKPYFGICIGMQVLFKKSDEGICEGLGIFEDTVTKLSPNKPVPHMGWNVIYPKSFPSSDYEKHFYFVHSYAVPSSDKAYIHSTSCYGDSEFVSSVKYKKLFATQFHPEKSGQFGIQFIKNILNTVVFEPITVEITKKCRLTKRIIACLDVREDENGELVVTKGYGYDVRQSGKIRNIGNPVVMSKKYYNANVDELCFLSIKSYNNNPLDTPLIQLLKDVSKEVFVPLTIGGGISDKLDAHNNVIKAVDIAAAYFIAGADKVSIGSDAVKSVIKYLNDGDRDCSISNIAKAYGHQAVVVSIDPKRTFITQLDKAKYEHDGYTVLELNNKFCIYNATISGGRTSMPLCAIKLAITAVELGAGELIVNCIDEDGKCNGFDLVLLKSIRESVAVPLIASSGAGNAQHFVDAFAIDCDAALAAGIFHRDEISIDSVKSFCHSSSLEIRLK